MLNTFVPSCPFFDHNHSLFMFIMLFCKVCILLSVCLSHTICLSVQASLNYFSQQLVACLILYPPPSPIRLGMSLHIYIITP